MLIGTLYILAVLEWPGQPSMSYERLQRERPPCETILHVVVFIWTKNAFLSHRVTRRRAADRQYCSANGA